MKKKYREKKEGKIKYSQHRMIYITRFIRMIIRRIITMIRTIRIIKIKIKMRINLIIIKDMIDNIDRCWHSWLQAFVCHRGWLRS